MDSLMELVSAAFARYGIESPAERSSAADGNSHLASADAAHLAESHLAAVFPDHNYRKSMQGDPAP
jgi:hypothetical protein